MSAGGVFTVIFAIWALAQLLATRDPDTVDASLIQKHNRQAATVTSYPLLDGGTWRLDDHKGKVVVVNLWASWCGPCREEMPDLVALANESKSEGIEFLGVSMDQGSDAPIRHAVTEFHIPYTIARGIDERSYSLGVPMPTTLVYDRDGRLAIQTVGAIDVKAFRRLLGALLVER